MSDEEVTKFDLKVVHDNFITSLLEDDDVHLKYYLDSYDELNKFFTLMGTVFGFVSNDLKSKMDILSDFINGEDGENFETVKTMIEHEKRKNLLEKKGYVSGSRTLLRLHRGLDFIREFLRLVSELKDKDSTSNVCRDAYNKTLAKHHPFMIRQGAKIAMYSMPTREDLLKRVCGEDIENIQRTIEILPRTLEITATVFQRIEDLYTLHDLHNLP